MKISLRKLNCICLVLSIILDMTVEIRYLEVVSISIWPSRYLIVLFCITGAIIELHAKVSKRLIEIFFLMAAYFLIYAVATRYNARYYLISFVLIVLAFFLYNYLLQQNEGFHELIEAFVDIMIIMGCVTVFFWMFGSVLDILPGRTELMYTWAGKTRQTFSYSYVYFENPEQNQQLLGSTWPRNCGIFTEAPAYSGLLLYAIGIELFATERINSKKLIPLLITVLTVQSTKAFVILIVLFAVHQLTKESGNRTRAYFIFRTVASIAIMIGGFFVLWFILEEKSSTYSYAARMNHLTAGFRTWLQNPIFGAGFNNMDALVENEAEGAGYGGTSMGLAVLFAFGGLYLAAFYAFAFFFALRNSHVRERKRGYLMFSLMLLMNLFISNSAFGAPYKFMIAAAYAAGAQESAFRTINKKALNFREF